MKPSNFTELFFYEARLMAAGYTDLAVYRTLSEMRDVLSPGLMSGEVRINDTMKFVEAAA